MLSTAVFGQTAFGIKSAAVLWSIGWSVLWARLILDMLGDRRLAFWSLLALNLAAPILKQIRENANLIVNNVIDRFRLGRASPSGKGR